MQDILASLAHGLHKAEIARTARTLGDRSRYVGMSDIGKAADCLRTAVLGKLKSPGPGYYPELQKSDDFAAILAGKIPLHRGHWFEDGIAAAFRLSGKPVLHQMSVHIRHGEVPLIAHLDFVLIPEGETPRIQVVEMKSTGHIPDTAYAAHEVQLSGQIGLLQRLWNRPCFMVQPGPLRTFPELVRHLCNITLPDQPEHVAIEGAILMLSMNDLRIFGPYTPNTIMTDMALSLAGQIWSAAAAIRAGTKTVDELPIAKGFHPLCDFCAWNADCPKFTGMTVSELEQDLLELCRLRDAREATMSRVQEMEGHMKAIFRSLGSRGDWIDAITRRFRVSACEGRKTLDKERLLAALGTCLSEDEAEAVIQSGYKTGEPFERIVMGTINSS